MVHDSRVNQVILIIFDDIRASQLFELMNKGKLPNINELADNGIKCSNCITAYPSITFPCYG
ncbi:MAG: alkaline phosphatase family protein, partial [Candidatus Hermodarchaeota archaeon]